MYIQVEGEEMKIYELVYQEIENKILMGYYPEETYLPSESQLCKQFDASRDTIRKALSRLTDHGYIKKVQGKGSFILKKEQLRFPVSGLTSYKELKNAYGYHSETIVEQLTKRTIDANLAQKTGFEENSEVWSILRSRKIDEQKVILDWDLIAVEFVPELDTEIAKDSLYAYFEQKLNLEIAFAEKEITVDPIVVLDRNYLDLNIQDTYVVAVKSRVFLKNLRQFQYTESHHRLDKFKFHDFARRHQL